MSKPDDFKPKPPEIYLADFGYGGSHIDKKPKDDIHGLCDIIKIFLDRLRPDELNAEDRNYYIEVLNFSNKILQLYKTNKVEKHIFLRQIYDEFIALREKVIRELKEKERSVPLTTSPHEPGDYLVAESIGLNADEWKSLFVPEFLAADDLLSKNTTILTGARGCGKTMIFRRLTAYMDYIIGANSGVPKSDQFVGFYINCRDLIEAFPFIPDNISNNLSAQIIHYFHLCWFAEITKTLSSYSYKDYGSNNQQKFEWLDKLMIKFFGDNYNQIPKDADLLANIRAFIEDEKERCRSASFFKSEKQIWFLSRFDFLDSLINGMIENVVWLNSKPIYLFLDDYTTPIIPRNVQRILNAIIFRRRSNLFFKISTESSLSFERNDFNGKPLELSHDFQFIDLATVSLHQAYKEKELFLSQMTTFQKICLYLFLSKAYAHTK